MKLYLNGSKLVFGKLVETKVLEIGLRGYYCATDKSVSKKIAPYDSYAISEIVNLAKGQKITVKGIAGNSVGVISLVDTAGALTSDTMTTAIEVSINGVNEYSYTAVDACRVVFCGTSGEFDVRRVTVEIV